MPRHNHGASVIGGILDGIQRRVDLRRVKIDKAQRVSAENESFPLHASCIRTIAPPRGDRKPR